MMDKTQADLNELCLIAHIGLGANASIGQSSNQSTNQSIKRQSINQPINQSTNISYLQNTVLEPTDND